MKLHKLLVLLLLIYFVTGCTEEKCELNTDEVYLNYWDHEGDSTAEKCVNEIEDNELYASMNFNDTTTANPGMPRFWSNFSYSTVVIQGAQFEEINLSVHRNPLITWFTEPPNTICWFRFDPKLQSLKIFHFERKKYIDFRQDEGKAYFEGCLRKFADSHEDI